MTVRRAVVLARSGAVLLLALGLARVGEAEAALRKSLTLDPVYAFALIHLGNTLRERGHGRRTIGVKITWKAIPCPAAEAARCQ